MASMTPRAVQHLEDKDEHNEDDSHADVHLPAQTLVLRSLAYVHTEAGGRAVRRAESALENDAATMPIVNNTVTTVPRLP